MKANSSYNKRPAVLLLLAMGVLSATHTSIRHNIQANINNQRPTLLAQTSVRNFGQLEDDAPGDQQQAEVE